MGFVSFVDKRPSRMQGQHSCFRIQVGRATISGREPNKNQIVYDAPAILRVGAKSMVGKELDSNFYAANYVPTMRAQSYGNHF